MPLKPLYLQLALRELELTPMQIGLRLSTRQARNLSWFLAGKTPLETDTLAALAVELSTLNTRYVLTGEGPPLV